MKRTNATLIFGLIFLILLIGNVFSQGAGEYVPGTNPQPINPSSPNINQAGINSPQVLNDKTRNPNVLIEEKNGLVTISVTSDSGFIFIGPDKKFENLKKGSKITYQKVGDIYEPVNGRLEPADSKNYEIFGYDIKVPKEGALLFEKKDQIMNIKVIVPKDTIIEQPKVLDKDKIKNTKLSYESKEGDYLKLSNEGNYMTLNREKDEKTHLFFDPITKQFYSEKPFKVDNLEIGTFRNSGSGKTYLLFKESDVSEFKDKTHQNFLYLGNKDDKYKVILGAFASDSPSVRFISSSGNIFYGGIKASSEDMLVLQARGTSEKSIITVTNRDSEKNIPLIKAEGEYDMFHGNSYTSYTKSGGLRHAYINKRTFGKEEIDFAKTKAINVELETKDSNGKTITQTVNVQGKSVIEEVNWNMYIDKNNIRLTSIIESQKILRSVTFNQLDPISQTKLLGLKKEDQLRLIGLELNQLRTEIEKINAIANPTQPVQPPGVPPPPQVSVDSQKKLQELTSTKVGPLINSKVIQVVTQNNPSGYDVNKHKVIVAVFKSPGCSACSTLKNDIETKIKPNNPDVLFVEVEGYDSNWKLTDIGRQYLSNQKPEAPQVVIFNQNGAATFTGPIGNNDFSKLIQGGRG